MTILSRPSRRPAKKAGYSYKNYIKAMYGTLVTPGVFEEMSKNSVLLSAFQNNHLNSLNYTDEQIEQYYQDNQPPSMLPPMTISASAAPPPPPRMKTATP